MTENQRIAGSLHIVGRKREWWIKGEGHDDASDATPMIGPYKTKDEARDIKRDVQRFYRNCHSPAYYSTSSQAKRRTKR